MVHPEREGMMHTCHLIVVELHRVDCPTPVIVVLRVRTEYAGEQNAGVLSHRVNGMGRAVVRSGLSIFSQRM